MIEGRDSPLKKYLRKITGSVDGWRDYWFDRLDSMQYIGLDKENQNPSNWFFEKEVRIFKMPEVDERVVPYVVKGIQELIEQIGLDFNLKYIGLDSAVEQQVKNSTQEGKIHCRRLEEILITKKERNPQYSGKPHADVIITDQHRLSGEEDWGQSFFSFGYIALFLPGTRQKSLDFIRNIAKHEAGHLFGFQEHHNQRDVKGYKQVEDCNMLWRASTNYTCDKCADALTYFWMGVERRTGKKFFRI